MGKKKSIVLMVLLTIVIVVLCAITVVPSFTIPKTVKIWNPVVKQYDLGADLDGGYYAYYYPTGVISETEYKNLDSEDQAGYQNHKGLYLSKDADLGIITEEGTVSKDFEENFAKATAEITARYAKKGYSDYRISVVDDYALAIRIPASEKTEQQSAFQNAYTTFGWFAENGALEIKKGDALVDEMAVDGYEVNEIIEEFSVYTKYEVAYIQVKFTSVGKDMIKAYKDSTETDTLKITLGEETIMEINAAEHITTKNVVRYPVAMETEIGYVDTMVILLNSALENGGFEIEFKKSVSNSEVRTYSAVYGENTLTRIYIALAIVIVALIVFSAVTMKGFGASSAYSTVSYLIITAMCYAFITGGVFEITLGSILAFVLGLVLVTVLDKHIFAAIKNEASLGKTIESSVKGGYKKTIMTVVDVYMVLTLGAVALLIGVAGVNTFALQALICIITAAFCNLLWTRVINAMLLSASKDKYKYFGLVREDDDDE